MTITTLIPKNGTVCDVGSVMVGQWILWQKQNKYMWCVMPGVFIGAADCVQLNLKEKVILVTMKGAE